MVVLVLLKIGTWHGFSTFLRLPRPGGKPGIFWVLSLPSLSQAVPWTTWLLRPLGFRRLAMQTSFSHLAADDAALIFDVTAVAKFLEPPNAKLS